MATKFMGGALGHTYLKSIYRGGLGTLIIGDAWAKLSREQEQLERSDLHHRIVCSQ